LINHKKTLFISVNNKDYMSLRIQIIDLNQCRYF